MAPPAHIRCTCTGSTIVSCREATAGAIRSSARRNVRRSSRSCCRRSRPWRWSGCRNVRGTGCSTVTSPFTWWPRPGSLPGWTTRIICRVRWRAPRALGVVWQRQAPPARDSVEIPGTPLILTRGQPTDITVVNHLVEPTAVHWHGIELESYSDGVAGGGGGAGRLGPPLAPRDPLH